MSDKGILHDVGIPVLGFCLGVLVAELIGRYAKLDVTSQYTLDFLAGGIGMVVGAWYTSRDDSDPLKYPSQRKEESSIYT